MYVMIEANHCRLCVPPCLSCLQDSKWQTEFVNIQKSVDAGLAGRFGLGLKWNVDSAISLYNKQRTDLFVVTEASVTATVFGTDVNVAQGQIGITAGAGKQDDVMGE
jgi:hypothetical protein